MRTVVVGASSGLGRCIAVDRGRRGDTVALLARRKDRLADAAREAGGGAFGVACDVTDEASVRDAIEEAATKLGGIDALVYATGVGTLRHLADIDADLWRWTFETNVIGASLVTAAAIPHLEASTGVAAYLSSVQSSHTPPWPGLGSYAVSKAALDKLVEAWRAEHPTVGFTRVVVGECAGGEGDAQVEFSAGWDRDLAAEVAPTWIARNYMSGLLMEVDELLRVMDNVLALTATGSIPSVTVMPRHPT
ncbi:MAG TPA: SDR family oxidoreductase [Acidimicrobiales bacterium]|nr:SDR family oxidoreductase [Acidimicrobiales bacterium]